MKKLLFYLVLIIGIATSCSSIAHLKTDDVSTNYKATNPNAIEVYSTEKAKDNYNIIGEVVASADAGKNAAKSVDLLKKEASRLGADAIVNLRLEIAYGGWSSGIKATGTAIKYLN